MKVKIHIRKGIPVWVFATAYMLFTWLDNVPGFDEVCCTQAEWDAGMIQGVHV
jgi:hypothetical protein